MMLKPTNLPRPQQGDSEYFSFIEIVETLMADGFQAHQDATNTVLLGMKNSPLYHYNIVQVDTLVFESEPPMPEQRYLTTIHYGVLASPGDGPSLSGL